MISLSDRSFIHSINRYTVARSLGALLILQLSESVSLTQKGIFLPERVLSIEQSLRRRPGFADQADLA